MRVLEIQFGEPSAEQKEEKINTAEDKEAFIPPSHYAEVTT